MKKLFIILISISTIAATSCKKDSDVTPKTVVPVTNVEKETMGKYD